MPNERVNVHLSVRQVPINGEKYHLELKWYKSWENKLKGNEMRVENSNKYLQKIPICINLE